MGISGRTEQLFYSKLFMGESKESGKQLSVLQLPLAFIPQ